MLTTHLYIFVNPLLIRYIKANWAENHKVQRKRCLCTSAAYTPKVRKCCHVNQKTDIPTCIWKPSRFFRSRFTTLTYTNVWYQFWWLSHLTRNRSTQKLQCQIETPFICYRKIIQIKVEESRMRYTKTKTKTKTTSSRELIRWMTNIGTPNTAFELVNRIYRG